MKKHKFPFLLTSMLIGLVPLFVASATISLVAIHKMKSNLEKDAYLRLQAASTAVREYFEWDINEDILAVDDASLGLIDALNQDKEKVLEEVRSLSAISEENTASCQETTDAIKELRKNIEMINYQTTNTNSISEELKESVAYFEL